MKIREAIEEDALNLAKIIRDVESTSDYMKFARGEREWNPQNQKRMIQAFQKEVNSVIMLAENEVEIAGYLIAKGGIAPRTRHTAYIVIGISEKFRRKGIGTMLFQELELWASKNCIHRLELTVISTNIAGIGLYEKMGFAVEGLKRHSLKIENQYVDEFCMSRLL